MPSEISNSFAALSHGTVSISVAVRTQVHRRDAHPRVATPSPDDLMIGTRLMTLPHTGDVARPIDERTAQAKTTTQTSAVMDGWIRSFITGEVLRYGP